jgi:hypothetical protein
VGLSPAAEPEASRESTEKTNLPQRAQRAQRKIEGIPQKFKILRRNLHHLKANFKNLRDLCELRGVSDLFAAESGYLQNLVEKRSLG